MHCHIVSSWMARCPFGLFGWHRMARIGVSRYPLRNVGRATRGREWAGAMNRRKSNAEIAVLDLVIGPQLFRLGRINHLTLAHDVDVVDELQRKRGILLDQQDRHALLLELGDSLPHALDDDG